jgi:sialate O-acetylesterase
VNDRRPKTVPAELAAYNAGDPPRLILDSIPDGNATWLNGQKVGETENPTNARNYVLPPNLLKAGTNIIAVRVLARTLNAGLPGKPEKVNLYFNHGRNIIPLAGEWSLQTGVELKSAPPLQIRDDRKIELTSLFNGYIAPLLPLSLTGVVWYQGENNAYQRSYRYRTLLPTLVKDWRTRFGQGDVPFLIVSLANFNYLPRQNQPTESAWAELREAQAMTAKSLPACGLTVTIDVGEAGNIHPVDKQSVGYRLALARGRRSRAGRRRRK